MPTIIKATDQGRGIQPVAFNFDDIAFPGGNSGDGCAFFDGDEDGFADFAVSAPRATFAGRNNAGNRGNGTRGRGRAGAVASRPGARGNRHGGHSGGGNQRAG